MKKNIEVVCNGVVRVSHPFLSTKKVIPQKKAPKIRKSMMVWVVTAWRDFGDHDYLVDAFFQTLAEAKAYSVKHRGQYPRLVGKHQIRRPEYVTFDQHVMDCWG